MNNPNKCPKCGQYIFGEYCCSCQIDIRNYIIESDDTVIKLKDIFGIDDE